MKTIRTSGVAETEAFGAELAREMIDDASIPRFVALCGDLGVGKTALVRGFASVWSPSSPVRSPTFSLVNEYRSPRGTIFHFDLYRIEDEDDLASIGYEDYLNRSGVCLVEWSEKFPDSLPERYLKVTIEKCGADRPDDRKITVEPIEEVSV